ncbi:hypothetical protein C8F01DRAFT_1366879 [Mycena amicta]|nr:hypothetical protein C8F01DRAFT_1366879 [Mycena amicta]
MDWDSPSPTPTTLVYARILSTCRVFRDLESQPTLWLAAIDRLETVRLHPVTYFLPDGNVAALPLRKLQALVKRAARILRNLNSPRPVLSPIGTFTLGAFAATKFIPGTGLLLTSVGGVVSCWDVVAQRCVAWVEMSDLSVLPAPCVSVGTTVLFSGGFSRQDDLVIRNLAAIYIDVEDIEHVHIDVVVSPLIGKAPRTFWPEHFLTTQLMGYSTDSEIVVWDFATNSLRPQPYVFPRDGGGQGSTCGIIHHPPSKLLYGFAPGYHQIQDDAAIHSAPIQQQPRVQVSAIPPHPPSTQPLPIRFPTAQSQAELWAKSTFSGSGSVLPILLNTYDKYGVFAVTYRSFYHGTLSARYKEHYLHFFTTRRFQDTAPGLGLEWGESVPYQFPRFVKQKFGVGFSGRYIFVDWSPQDVVPPAQSQAEYHRTVGLVCLCGDSGSDSSSAYTQLRRFHDPDGRPAPTTGPTWSLRSSIAVDDILGLVAIRDAKGVVSVYSYSGDWGKGPTMTGSGCIIG